MDIELTSPLRLNTYRNEKTNTQTFQWVLGEYENRALAKWKNVVSGANVVVETVDVVDVISEMYFSVTSNTSAGNVVLFVDQIPTLTINNKKNGTCVYGGDIMPYDITENLFNTNSLIIYKNGVKQMKGTDVSFVSENHLLFRDRLQVGDIIVLDHVNGAY